MKCVSVEIYFETGKGVSVTPCFIFEEPGLKEMQQGITDIWLHAHYVGRTESHEQLFFACNLGIADVREYGVRWNQLCVNLECLVTSIDCIT
jgi:hypothetical protein